MAKIKRRDFFKISGFLGTLSWPLKLWAQLIPHAMWAKSTAFKDTIWTVGDNASGQLATGNTTNRSTPYTIDVGKGWAQVSGGSNSALAIKNNGTLWSWGGNGIGQIGDQTTANRSSPVQIGEIGRAHV